MTAKKTTGGVAPLSQAEQLGEMAHDRVAGDLVDHVMLQVERLKKPFADLTEIQQRDFLGEIEGAVETAVREACLVIAAGTPLYMAGTVKQVQLKGAEEATATVKLWLKDNDALISAAELSGGPCVIVGASVEQWMVGLGEYEAEPDQLSLETGEEDEVPAGAKLYFVIDEKENDLGRLVVQGEYRDGDIVTQKAGKEEFAFTVQIEVDEGGEVLALFLIYRDKPERLSALPFFKPGVAD